MSIVVKINAVDKSNHIDFASLQVKQNLTSQVDTASFKIRKYGGRTLVPSFDDYIEVLDGLTTIFAGKILKIDEDVESGGDGVVYRVDCVDHTYEFDKLLVSRTYENQTIKEIITDICSSYAPDFDADNVESEFEVEKIVFNQISPSNCLKKLAEIVGDYNWYIDENKSIHFFSKFSKSAPFDLTDTNGNYVYKSLNRKLDGSQVVNRIKVRGGEYNGNAYEDVITVKGNDSKSFKLPYKFANLTIQVDTGGGYVSKTVGVDFIDDFTSNDVLYNYQDQMIRFENPLSDGNKIKFSGNPKVRVFAVSEEPSSIANYGKIEKLIRDTSIKSNTIARRRANAESYVYNEPVVDAKFDTYQSGLRVGMLINIQSDKRGNDDNLLIKSITFRAIDPNNFKYSVDCVSTKRYGLIEFLQKLIEPEPSDMDEVEVSEEIFTDTQEVTVEEEITLVSPYEDQQEVTISENYIKDPLGAGVEPTYVLSPYTPTGQDDTKRPGRLGISMKVY